MEDEVGLGEEPGVVGDDLVEVADAPHVVERHPVRLAGVRVVASGVHGHADVVAVVLLAELELLVDLPRAEPHLQPQVFEHRRVRHVVHAHLQRPELRRVIR